MIDFGQIESLCEDRELFGKVVTKGTYTPDEAALIGAAYLQIFKKQVVRTCGNCLGDALTELVALYRKNREQMKEQNECRYRLRAGLLIRLNFGDSVYYSNANLTDKVAEEYILANPSRLSDFESYPESIEKKIGGAESKTAKATAAKRSGKKSGKTAKATAARQEAEPEETQTAETDSETDKE